MNAEICGVQFAHSNRRKWRLRIVLTGKPNGNPVESYLVFNKLSKISNDYRKDSIDLSQTDMVICE